MVGQLGGSKNSHSYLKLILCCSLPNVIHHIKFHANRMKNTDFQIFEILDPPNFFENSTKAKLSKLEPFAWSHWIRNCLNYLHCLCKHRAHKDHKMAQLGQIASSDNWKPRFSSKSQKSKIVCDFFPDKHSIYDAILHLRFFFLGSR